MKHSYGSQMVKQYLDGLIDLDDLETWAASHGKKNFNPLDTESIYLAALIAGMKSEGVPERGIYDTLSDMDRQEGHCI